MADQNASSVYLCKALTVPSLYTNNKGATEWGTICQRAKSIFTSHSLLWKNSWNELGFRRTGGSLPVGPSPHPLSRVCAGAHRDLPAHHQSCPLVTQSPHPSPRVLHNRTNAPPFSLARWGRTALGQNEPNRPNWMTGTYLHISQRPQLPVLFNFVFFAIVAHK